MKQNKFYNKRGKIKMILIIIANYISNSYRSFKSSRKKRNKIKKTKYISKMKRNKNSSKMKRNKNRSKMKRNINKIKMKRNQNRSKMKMNKNRSKVKSKLRLFLSIRLTLLLKNKIVHLLSIMEISTKQTQCVYFQKMYLEKKYSIRRIKL